MKKMFKGFKVSGEFKEGFYVLLRSSVETERRWSRIDDMSAMIDLTKRGKTIEFIEASDLVEIE